MVELELYSVDIDINNLKFNIKVTCDNCGEWACSKPFKFDKLKKYISWSPKDGWEEGKYTYWRNLCPDCYKKWLDSKGKDPMNEYFRKAIDINREVDHERNRRGAKLR